MKYSLFIPLSLSAIFFACDSINTVDDSANSSETNPPNYFKGILSNDSTANNSDNNSTVSPIGTSDSASSEEPSYERHFDSQDGFSSYKCNVYTTDNSVLLDMDFELFGGTSSMKQHLVTDFSSPATYSGTIEATGLFSYSLADKCVEVKESFNEAPNGSASCTDTSIVFTSDIPTDDFANKETYLLLMKKKMNTMCDEFFDEFYEDFGPSGVPSSSANSGAEAALSCNVNVQGNTMAMSVVYTDKSAFFSLTEVNGVYTMTETYTGIDQATLDEVCEAYKTEEDISNVSCSNSVISYTPLDEDMDVDIQSYASYMELAICPYLLNGGLTLEDLWYDN